MGVHVDAVLPKYHSKTLTKLFVEEMLKDWATTKKQKSAIILRYFNPVGAHSSGLLGEDPAGAPNNLMPIIADVALGKLPYIDIYGNDYSTRDGTGERDYIHVVDLALAHVDAIWYNCSGTN